MPPKGAGKPSSTNTASACSPSAQSHDELIAQVADLQARLEKKDARISLLQGQLNSLVSLSDVNLAVETATQLGAKARKQAAEYLRRTKQRNSRKGTLWGAARASLLRWIERIQLPGNAQMLLAFVSEATGLTSGGKERSDLSTGELKRRILRTALAVANILTAIEPTFKWSYGWLLALTVRKATRGNLRAMELLRVAAPGVPSPCGVYKMLRRTGERAKAEAQREHHFQFDKKYISDQAAVYPNDIRSSRASKNIDRRRKASGATAPVQIVGVLDYRRKRCLVKEDGSLEETVLVDMLVQFDPRNQVGNWPKAEDVVPAEIRERPSRILELTPRQQEYREAQISGGARESLEIIKDQVRRMASSSGASTSAPDAGLAGADSSGGSQFSVLRLAELADALAAKGKLPPLEEEEETKLCLKCRCKFKKGTRNDTLCPFCKLEIGSIKDTRRELAREADPVEHAPQPRRQRADTSAAPVDDEDDRATSSAGASASTTKPGQVFVVSEFNVTWLKPIKGNPGNYAEAERALKEIVEDANITNWWIYVNGKDAKRPDDKRKGEPLRRLAVLSTDEGTVYEAVINASSYPREHVLIVPAFGHADFNCLELNSALAWEFAGKELILFSVFLSEKGAEVIRKSKSKHKGFDMNVMLFCSAVQISLILAYARWLVQQHKEEKATYTEVVADLSTEKWFDWLRTDFGDPGLSMIAHIFVLGVWADYKCIRAGIRGFDLDLLFAGLKGEVSWLLVRDHDTYGKRMIEEIFRMEHLYPKELAEYLRATSLCHHREGATDLLLENFIRLVCQQVGRGGTYEQFLLGVILAREGGSLDEAVFNNTDLDIRRAAEHVATLLLEELWECVEKILASGSLDIRPGGNLRSVLNSPVEGVCGGLPVTCKEDILKVATDDVDRIGHLVLAKVLRSEIKAMPRADGVFFGAEIAKEAATKEAAKAARAATLAKKPPKKGGKGKGKAAAAGGGGGGGAVGGGGEDEQGGGGDGDDGGGAQQDAGEGAGSGDEGEEESEEGGEQDGLMYDIDEETGEGSDGDDVGEEEGRGPSSGGDESE